MEVTSSFRQLLGNFESLFTAPTYRNFLPLVSGWLFCTIRRCISNLILFSDSQHDGSFSKFYRFFSRSKWELDLVSQVLARIVIPLLAPAGLILLAVDDTLCHKRGHNLFGAGMHYDPLISSRASPLKSWGHNWVVVTLLLRNPFWATDSVFSLPLMFGLYRNWQGNCRGKKKTKAHQNLSKQQREKLKRQEAKRRAADPTHQTRPALAIKVLSLLGEWFPTREFLVVADSAYGGHSVLSKLPANVHLISSMHPKGVMYDPAPPPMGKEGRPPKKGARLPGLKAWSDDPKEPWKKLKFQEYGLHTTLEVKFRRNVLYYKSGGTRLLNVVLTRDVTGHRPDKMFYCTKLDLTPRQILSAYAARWSIEVCFENAKQLAGFEDPGNRLPKGVERTAPLSMVLYTLSILWFHQTGHTHLKYPDRPWYPAKHAPSYADILSTLRRESYLEWFSEVPCSDRRIKTKIAHLVEFLSLSG